jgi:predicted transcriptional regulator
VDRGETTWEAVRDGSDDHPSSIRVRQMITANLDQLAEVMARDPEMVEQQRELDLRNAELARLRDADDR